MGYGKQIYRKCNIHRKGILIEIKELDGLEKKSILYAHQKGIITQNNYHEGKAIAIKL